MTDSTSVKLSHGTRDRLRAIAVTKDRSVNQVMNEAIGQYLDREERRAAFLAEVEERWLHYKLTGEHITQEEAEVWIDQLLLGIDPPVPEAHK